MSHGASDGALGAPKSEMFKYIKWILYFICFLVSVSYFRSCKEDYQNSRNTTSESKDAEKSKITWVRVWHGYTPYSREFDGYFQYDSFGAINIHTVDRNNPKGPKNVTPYSGKGVKQTLPERGYGDVDFTSQGSEEVYIILYEPKLN